MNDFIVKCPDCGSNRFWQDDGAAVASDGSFVDVPFQCRVCKTLFDVEYRPKGYSHT